MYIPLVAGAVLPGPATPSGAVPPAEGAPRLEVVDQPAAPPDEVEVPPQLLDVLQKETVPTSTAVPITGAEPRRPEPTPGLPRPNGSPDPSHPVLAPTALPGPTTPTVPPPSTTPAPTRPEPTPWVTSSTTPDPPTLEQTGGWPT